MLQYYVETSVQYFCLKAEWKYSYVFEMADCSCSNFHSNWARFEVVELISMETGDQTNFFPLLHDGNAAFFFKEVLLTENINKNRRNFFIIHSLFNSRDLWLNYIFGLFLLSFSFGNSMSSTKSADNSHLILVFIFCYFNCFQHFHFVLSIQPISWFYLYCGCSQFVHSGEITIEMFNQIINWGFCHWVCTVSDSESSIENVDVTHSV